MVPCASLPVTHVSRSPLSSSEKRAKNEASEEKAGFKGLFAGSVVQIWYAGIDTEHPTFYCFAVVLFTWPLLTTTYQLYLLLNCRWLQMPCAACFQLNVHPGKNSFHRKHTSLDCTYMFWRLLESYQVFFLSSVANVKIFLAELEIRGLSAGKGPINRERNLGFDHTKPDSFLCRHEKFSGIVWTPIWYVTLHFKRSARCSFAPLQKARQITVLMCEQKPYPEWFLCRRKSYPVLCKHSLRLSDGRHNTPQHLANRPVIPDGWRHQACQAYRIFFYQIHCVRLFRL